jgi:hypothetical protein
MLPGRVPDHDPRSTVQPRKPALQRSPGDARAIATAESALAHGDSRGLTPGNVAALQGVVGNRAMQRVAQLQAADAGRSEASAARKAASGPGPVLQRHPIRPDKLVATVVDGVKAKWVVADILTADKMAILRTQMQALIPPDAKPSPQERIASLKFLDHDKPEGMPKGYDTVAAKVDGDSGEVHFNNSLNDYYNKDGSVNKNKVLSTIVHEAFHAVSAEHKGLQGDEYDLLKGGTAIRAPDEAITEYFAVQVYQALTGKGEADYETGYWVAEGGKAPVGAADKKKMVLDKELPQAWTGQLVGIMKSVLGVNDEQIKEIYFKDPTKFTALIQGKKPEIQAKWDLIAGKQTLEWHGVLTGEAKDTVISEAITAKAGELKADNEDEWFNLVKAALVDKKVPEEAFTGKFPAIAPAAVKAKVKQILKL